MITALITFLAVVVVLFVVLKLLKVSFKIIWKILVNAAVGGLVLFLLNLIPELNLPINWLTAICTGIFGLPAVVVILIISLI